MGQTGKAQDRVEQDIQEAIKTAQVAIQQAIKAVMEIGAGIAQFIEKIEESNLKAKEAFKSSALGLKNQTQAVSLDPLVAGLNTKAQQLAQKNHDLRHSLKELRSLQGALPLDRTQELTRHLSVLDKSLEATHEKNQKMISALAKNAVLHSQLPPLSSTLQTKAVASMNLALSASKNGPQATVRQAAALAQLNVKTAFMGHKLTEATQKSALAVKATLETKLNETASLMKQFRTSLTPAPEQKENQKQQPKKKI
jgi:hypothetical protein